LAHRLGEQDVVTPVMPDEEGYSLNINPRNFNVERNGLKIKLRNHSSIGRAVLAFGEMIYDYFVFTVEREPVEKCISGFYWSYQEAVYETASAEIAAFEQYAHENFAKTSSVHQYSIAGVPIIDAIVNQANLAHDLQAIYDRLSLGNTEVTNIKAKASTRPPQSRGPDAVARLVSPQLRKFLEYVGVRETRLLSGDWTPISRDVRKRLYQSVEARGSARPAAFEA
jgi:hypothetical protein